MPLGIEIGLGPGHNVLDGDSAPLPQRGHSPPTIFGPRFLWPKGWMDQDATWYDGRPRPGQHCLTCGHSSTPKGHSSHNFGQCLLWPNGWMYQDATSYKGRPRPRPHCVTWEPRSPSQNGHSPYFRPMSIVAKRSPISATAKHLLLYLWPPYAIGGPLYFCPVVSFFYLLLLLFFHRLISAVGDWMSSILLHMAWP